MDGESIVLRGGVVVDGTGAPGRRLDVAVDGGRITAIAPTLRGDEEVDCTGAVVAPGFIDLHTHYDAQLLWDPACSSSCWHGVTTVVVGNCGFSLSPCPAAHRPLMLQLLRDLEDMRPEALEAGIPWDFETFPEYLDLVRRRGVDLNIAAYVGHSAVRIAAMGAAAFERVASPDEIEAMGRMVVEAMRAGAVGFATSTSPTGRNCPSRHATPEESTALFRAMASTGRGVVATVPGGRMGHTDLYDLQPQLGRPVTWTALLSMADGRHEQWAALHRSGWAAGCDVRPQVSCRPQGGRTTLAEPFALRCPAVRELDGVDHATRRRAYADPAWRSRAAAELETSLTRPRWDAWTVLESTTAPELVGRTVSSIAAGRGEPSLDAALDIALADDLGTWFGFVSANDDEAAVRELLALDGVVLGLSDAGAHPAQICDAVLPTDLLGGWVRDRAALGLEHAVHKLTAEIADLLGLADRGRLRVGAAADVVVFDPDTVAPGPVRRVTDLPDGSERLVADRPTGVRHVLVNGHLIRRDERQVDDHRARPGRVLVPGP
jgi:N-acyl-D-aspartate/D-glutamate deacylase